MKKLLIVALAALSSFGLFAGIMEADLQTIILKKKTVFRESGVGFELINKANHPIWIAVSNGDNLHAGAGDRAIKVDAAVKNQPFKPMQIRGLDIQKPIKLAVWLSDPGTITFDKRYLVAGKRAFKPVPNKLYKFTEGMTAYVTWDKDDFARPQTGPLRGLLGKTDSNLSLADNVKERDITEVKAK